MGEDASLFQATDSPVRFFDRYGDGRSPQTPVVARTTDRGRGTPVQDDARGDAPPGPPDLVPPPNPYARTYRVGGFTVVELRGELDIDTARFVAPHLDLVSGGTPSQVIVVDLCRLEFLDCYGLSLLCRVRLRVLARDGELRTVCDRPSTLRLLRLTGLAETFRPVPTLGSALR
jgi:anti-sigma B factor antagonist